MSETPRYATLSDYVRVIRAQRWLILGVVVAFMVAGYLVSAVQTKKYTAETSLSFREIGQDLSFLGRESVPELAPDQRAAINAEEVEREEIARRVKRALDTELSVEQLQNAVTTQVGAKTNLVIVQATDESPEFAAELANAYGEQIRAVDLEEVRSRIDQAIRPLREQLGSGGAGSAFSDPITRQQLTQLETLREFVEPVEIARRAELPTEPSSPRTTRNTLLGALVGFAFGLLAAFVRDSLDRRLRRSDEVQSELSLPVIGRVPEEALGEPGFAVNGHGKTPAEAETYLEAYRVLRTNLEFLEADAAMRTVLVTSGLPEEGKSTVAMALAGAAAVAGNQVLLVECDLRRPCFAERLGLDPEPGLTDYLVGRASPRDVLQVVELISPASINGSEGTAAADEDESARMVCITAGSPAPLPAELLGSERFEHFLSKVSKAYDLVILDTSPILPVVDALELVAQVDAVLVCVRLSRTTREEARAAHDALSRVPERPTGVVVTGVRVGEDSYGYYYGSYGLEETAG